MMTSGSVSATSGTTKTKHDPLCRDHHACTCELIDRVRDDERALGRLTKSCRELVDRAYRNGYDVGYRSAQKDQS